jgi:hypothetical protein
MRFQSLIGLIGVIGSVSAATDELLYVLDIVNHGSAIPMNYLNATGVQHPYSGPGQVTPFGMR